jgi:simple sugar transport system permease protein
MTEASKAGGKGRISLPTIPWNSFAESAIAIVGGFVVGGIIVAIAGFSPALFYRGMIEGAFGSPRALLVTITYMTPIMLTGLSFAVAARANMFNIGSEGQLFWGVLAAAYIGAYVALPSVVHQVAIFVVAFALGGAAAALAGWLKVKRGVHEVVSTIMLNWISLYVLTYICIYFLFDPLRAYKTKDLLATAMIPFFDPSSSISYAVVIAIAACLACYFLLWRTSFGYSIRAVGLNPTSAEYGGIKVGRTMVMAMFISGGVAALAGSLEIMGRFGYVDTEASFVRNLGFDGIAVALVGRNHPLAIILSSFFFAMLKTGGQAVQIYTSAAGRTGIPLEMSLALQGVIIVFASIPGIIAMTNKYLERRKK